MSRATFNVLRTTHLHADGARCVDYPNYNEALCSLHRAVTGVGRTAGRLGNLGVNVVNYVMGNPNRVTSTSCNCMNTNPGQMDLCHGRIYMRGGVPRRMTMRRLLTLVSSSGRWFNSSRWRRCPEWGEGYHSYVSSFLGVSRT